MRDDEEDTREDLPDEARILKEIKKLLDKEVAKLQKHSEGRDRFMMDEMGMDERTIEECFDIEGYGSSYPYDI